MLKLGLTGGIGSGKSTVANMLRQSAAFVIDADALSHQLTQPGGAAIDRIRTIFGDAYITAKGAMDRQKMRELVFTDPDAKRRLEAIVHPLVAQEMRAQEALAQDAQHPCIVYDIPLLAESARWRQSLHWVLVVDCLPETQIARVVQRNQLSPEAVGKIMATQLPRVQRLQAADWVLYNDGLTIAELQGAVNSLARHFGL